MKRLGHFGTMDNISRFNSYNILFNHQHHSRIIPHAANIIALRPERSAQNGQSTMSVL